MLTALTSIVLVVLVLAALIYPWREGQIRRQGRSQVQLGNERVFSNIAEGTHEEFISRLPDNPIPAYFLLAKIGSDNEHADIATHTDIPIGVFRDTTLAVGGTDDLTLHVSIALFGAAEETRKVAINSTVAEGAFLVADDGGYAKTLPTSGGGTTYIFGRALMAGAAGDVIEFDPTLPYLVTIAS